MLWCARGRYGHWFHLVGVVVWENVEGENSLDKVSPEQQVAMKKGMGMLYAQQFVADERGYGNYFGVVEIKI